MAWKYPEMIDGDGYPTDAALLKIARFDTTHGDIEEWLDLVQALWSYPDRFCRSKNKRTLYLSTGGWSGNESVIRAMKQNFFWFIAHSKWQKGGHYWFELKPYMLKRGKKKCSGNKVTK